MAVEIDDRIIAEKEIFLTEAGTSRENFFLLGLRYNLTVRTSGEVQAVYLYSSDVPESESNRFSFVSVGDGVYTYEEVTGTGATALVVCTDPAANFANGVKFYFRVKVVGVRDRLVFNRLFWVRDPAWIFLFGPAELPYVSPYPVLVGRNTVSVAILPDSRNPAGVRKYGGIETVEVFTNPAAPSSGSHVVTQAETAVASFSQVVLPNRDNAGSILGFIPPPGAPDFSRYYHYLTFRVRSKAGSPNYRDINNLLFAAGSCAPEANAIPYGWGSSGSPTVPPPGEAELLTLLTGTPEQPLTVCGALTTITADSAFNQYSPSTQVLVYDQATGGTLLASGGGVVTGETTLEISRSALGGDTSQPIAGYFAVQEYGPDRTSENRVETLVFQCAVAVPANGYTPTSLEYVPENDRVELATTPGSDAWPIGTYQIRLYTAEYGGSPSETYSATRIDDHTLAFELTEDKAGYWSVVLNGAEVTAPRFYADVVLAVYEILSTTYDVVDDRAEITTTAESDDLPVGGTYTVRLYAAATGGSPTNTYAATRIDASNVGFALAEDKTGYWVIAVDGEDLTAPRFYAEINPVIQDSNFNFEEGYESGYPNMFTEHLGGGDYYCYRKLGAEHWRSGANLKAIFWNAYNPATQEFSDYFWQAEQVVFFPTEPSSVNLVRQKLAGTGIQNKLSLYPSGSDPYLSDTETRYCQGVETNGEIVGTATQANPSGDWLTDETEDFWAAGVDIGDTIILQNPSRTETITGFGDVSTLLFAAGEAITVSTTYTIPVANPNRKSIHASNPSIKEAAFLSWVLGNIFLYSTYDPDTDSTTPPGTGYCCCDISDAEASLGFNEEGEYVIVQTGAAPTAAIPLTQFYDVTPYHIAKRYIYPVFFKPGHDEFGGRLYWSKSSGVHYWYYSVAQGWLNDWVGHQVNMQTGGGTKFLDHWVSTRWGPVSNSISYLVT